MQNEPRGEEDAIVQGSWIKYVDMLPDEREIKMRAFTVDPAISKKETADYTAKIAGCLDRNGNIYIYRIGNDRMSFNENITDIKQWQEDLKVNTVGIETKAFQAAYAEVLDGLPILQLSPDTDKVRRTTAVSRFFQAGRIHILRGIKHSDRLFDQLVQFPNGAHDDLVDAITYLIQLLLIDVSLPKPPTVSTKNQENLTAGLQSKKF